MQLNFTVWDLAASGAGILVFPLFILVPGYVLGYVLDLASFRRRTPLLRLLLSLPLSLALTPVVVYLLGRQLSIAAVWAFYGLIWVSFGAMLTTWRRHSHPPNRVFEKLPRGVTKPLVTISVIWVAIALLSLVDLQLGHKLFFSTVSYDYTVRSAAVSQLARAQWFPPSNPFFFPGHPAPFRYHYFWFLVCSLPVRLAPGLIGPRHALFAGVVWIGFTLMSSVALFLRLFDENGAREIRRRTLLGFGLLCISGFDILPTLFLDFRRMKFHSGDFYPSVDWWNPDQVTGWLDSTFWVPHHLSGLLACMAGFLILWLEWRSPVKRIRWQAILGAGLAFGSAGGLSVYVAFVFAIFLGAWTLLAIIRKDRLQAVMMVLVGFTSLLVGLPFVRDLAAAGSGGTTGQGASFMKFGIRMFEPGHLLLRHFHLDTRLWIHATDFLLLPVNFLFELGALLLIGLIKVRQWMRSESAFTPANMAEVVMISVALFISIFVRSNTIETNDLGMRGMLIVQFVLVIWGADVLMEWRSRKSPSRDHWIRFAHGTLVASLVLGAATNVYELFILRSYTLLTEAGLDPGLNIINPGQQFGARAFATRQLYEWLNTNVPRSAIEQHNPANLYNALPGLYSNRQMAMADLNSASAFGGSQSESATLEGSLRALFGSGSAAVDVDSICERFKITHLIAGNDDPAWKEPQSWVWTRTPLYANTKARAFSCGARY